MALKIAILANLGQLTREKFRAINALARFKIRLRNRSKLVEGSIFASIGLLLEAKSITYMACAGRGE